MLQKYDGGHWRRGELRRIVTDFAVWNSASGIPHIARARNNVMRIFWSLVFIGCFLAFVAQMAFLVDTYLKYSVSVQTSLKSELLPFPAVTLCNLNPYKYSKVKEFPEVMELLDDYGKSMNGSLDVDRWNLTSPKGKIGKQLRARQSLAYIMATFDASRLTRVTYELDELVDLCSFNTKPCVNHTGSFREIRDPAYGRCFSFNNLLPVPEHYVSKRAGMVYGLRLILTPDLADYLPVTIAAGVRMVVHGQLEPIYPEAFGFDAATGFSTTCAMRFVRTERLPYPYGNCVQKSATEYSVEGCLRLCQQRIVVEHCNCSDPTFPLENGTSFCGRDKMSCIGDALAPNNYDASVNCSCPPLCSDGAYSVTISTAIWPSKRHLLPQCEDPRFDFDPAECLAWYQRNALAVAIFFERISFVLLSESEAYGLVSLVSDFGGQIGLWTGVSVITVVEIIFLPYLLISACCNRRPIDPDEIKDSNEFDIVGQDVADSWRDRIREGPTRYKHRPSPIWRTV